MNTTEVAMVKFRDLLTLLYILAPYANPHTGANPCPYPTRTANTTANILFATVILASAVSPYRRQLRLSKTAATHISPCLRKEGIPILTTCTAPLNFHRSPMCSLTTLNLALTHAYMITRLTACPANVAIPAAPIPNSSTFIRT